MFHKDLSRENYTCDPHFSFEKYTFIEANPNIESTIDTDFFGKNPIKEYELPLYDERLQKAVYMAPSIIYHAYKNNLHKDLDYIGFLEYDIPLKHPDYSSVTERIENIINGNQSLIVPYRYQHALKNLHKQKDIKINGKNAIDQIFDDYNQYFDTSFNRKDFMQAIITSQQSFLADTKTFEKIMGFISHVIENKLAERPNSWHRPSTLMDRYFGISLLLENSAKTVPLPLEHQNMKQWSESAGHTNMQISKQFTQKGWDVIPALLTEEECKQACRLFKVQGSALKKDVGTEKSIRRIAVMYKTGKFKKLIKKIKNNNFIATILSDYQEPIVEHMKPLIKAPAGGVETPWHQDSSFWTEFDPTQSMFTVWVALTKTDEKSGAMKILDNVKHDALIPHVHVHNGNERMIKEAILNKFLDEGRIVPCNLNPGDALIFRSDVIHSAFENHSDKARIAFKIVFQDAKKRPKTSPIGKFGFHLEGWLGKINLNTPINLFWSR